MKTSSWQLFGYKAHLVLEDDDGNLFEVEAPVLISSGVPRLVLPRVQDAIDEYEAQRVRPLARWPVF